MIILPKPSPYQRSEEQWKLQRKVTFLRMLPMVMLGVSALTTFFLVIGIQQGNFDIRSWASVDDRVDRAIKAAGSAANNVTKIVSVGGKKQPRKVPTAKVTPKPAPKPNPLAVFKEQESKTKVTVKVTPKPVTSRTDQVASSVKVTPKITPKPAVPSRIDTVAQRAVKNQAQAELKACGNSDACDKAYLRKVAGLGKVIQAPTPQVTRQPTLPATTASLVEVEKMITPKPVQITLAITPVPQLNITVAPSRPTTPIPPKPVQLVTAAPAPQRLPSPPVPAVTGATSFSAGGTGEAATGAIAFEQALQKCGSDTSCRSLVTQAYRQSYPTPVSMPTKAPTVGVGKDLVSGVVTGAVNFFGNLLKGGAQPASGGTIPAIDALVKERDEKIQECTTVRCADNVIETYDAKIKQKNQELVDKAAGKGVSSFGAITGASGPVVGTGSLTPAQLIYGTQPQTSSPISGPISPATSPFNITAYLNSPAAPLAAGSDFLNSLSPQTGVPTGASDVAQETAEKIADSVGDCAATKRAAGCGVALAKVYDKKTGKINKTELQKYSGDIQEAILNTVKLIDEGKTSADSVTYAFISGYNLGSKNVYNTETKKYEQKVQFTGLNIPETQQFLAAKTQEVRAPELNKVLNTIQSQAEKDCAGAETQQKADCLSKAQSKIIQGLSTDVAYAAYAKQLLPEEIQNLQWQDKINPFITAYYEARAKNDQAAIKAAEQALISKGITTSSLQSVRTDGYVDYWKSKVSETYASCIASKKSTADCSAEAAVLVKDITDLRSKDGKSVDAKAFALEATKTIEKQSAVLAELNLSDADLRKKYCTVACNLMDIRKGIVAKEFPDLFNNWVADRLYGREIFAANPGSEEIIDNLCITYISPSGCTGDKQAVLTAYFNTIVSSYNRTDPERLRDAAEKAVSAYEVVAKANEYQERYVEAAQIAAGACADTGSSIDRCIQAQKTFNDIKNDISISDDVKKAAETWWNTSQVFDMIASKDEKRINSALCSIGVDCQNTLTGDALISAAIANLVPRERQEEARRIPLKQALVNDDLTAVQKIICESQTCRSDMTDTEIIQLAYRRFPSSEQIQITKQRDETLKLREQIAVVNDPGKLQTECEAGRSKTCTADDIKKFRADLVASMPPETQRQIASFVLSDSELVNLEKQLTIEPYK